MSKNVSIYKKDHVVFSYLYEREKEVIWVDPKVKFNFEYILKL